MAYSTLERGSYMTRRSRVKSKPYRSVATRKGMIDLLDILTSKVVRKRDGKCVTCGSTEELQASHFYRRSYYIIRFDLRNVNCQCKRCNYEHSSKPWRYTNWFLEHYGVDVMSELHELRMSRARLTDEQLQSLIVEYRQMLRAA
jgi:hypothetical protein